MSRKKSPVPAPAKKRPADPLLEDIMEMAQEVVKLKKTGRELGMFMEDRDLLECPHCWLQEDVDSNGLHLVTLPLDRKKDTGLRFMPIGRSERRWRCPNCGRAFTGGVEKEVPDAADEDPKAALARLKVQVACHDLQIQAIFEMIRGLRERPGGPLMLPPITYPAPRPVKRPGITGGA